MWSYIKRLVFFISVLAIIGCSKDPKLHKQSYKYTIWVGSASFAAGYYTNEYEKEDDMVTFMAYQDGAYKRVVVPVCKLFKIDTNKDD